MPRAKKPAPPVIAPSEQITAAPVGPSPAVLELQGDIVGLVRERSGYRKLVAEIQAELFTAQSKFQATQGRLQQFDQEINERISLIAQLENRTPQSRMAHISEISDYQSPLSFAGNLTGISSEPTPQREKMQSEPSDMVNRVHIDRNQAQAMRSVL